MRNFTPLLAGLLLALFPTLALAQDTPLIPGQPSSVPVSPAPILAPSPPSATQPLPPAVHGTFAVIIGAYYQVELTSGNRFAGVLRSANEQELVFETKDIGTVHLQRHYLKQMLTSSIAQAPITAQVQPANDYVGNGNRYFFGPSARNLRKGEATAQLAEIFVLSLNYGLSDNFSMGGFVTILPGNTSNIAGLAPKLSFPASDRVRVGAGALLGFANSGSAGITYANVTFGSADTNLTGGLGYLFASDADFVKTPVLMLGGMARISRRVSLMNETYVLGTGDNYNPGTLVGGIMGVRIAGPRVGGSAGLIYGQGSARNGGYGGGYNNYYYGNNYYGQPDSGLLPFVEFTVRFGKIQP